MEWQNHQYDPGHYTGGNMHPMLKSDGKPGLIAILWFVLGVIVALPYFIFLFLTLKGDMYIAWGDRYLSKPVAVVLLSIIFGSLIIFSVCIGIKYRRKAKIKPQRQKKKKRR